jgi:hypothetical protein
MADAANRQRLACRFRGMRLKQQRVGSKGVGEAVLTESLGRSAHSTPGAESRTGRFVRSPCSSNHALLECHASDCKPPPWSLTMLAAVPVPPLDSGGVRSVCSTRVAPCHVMLQPHRSGMPWCMWLGFCLQPAGCAATPCDAVQHDQGRSARAAGLLTDTLVRSACSTTLAASQTRRWR